MNFIPAQSIISGYAENDFWFGNNYNMNIYKGCCHGCIYCDSRSECYKVDNFDEVRAKENALIIIERELMSKRKKGVIGTGAMSDPYNPFEKKYCLTKDALEIINRAGFGVSISTKSSLITRDIDILKEISSHSPVLINITITTANDELCKKIEPNVSVSSERFDAIKKLADNGIFTGVLLMPILPFINDTIENIGNIIDSAKASGAGFIYPAFGVTLRQNQREWYYKKLDESFPSLKEKYIKYFDNSYECSSFNSSKLWEFFKNKCDKAGIIYKMKDIIHTYKEKYQTVQISLF